MNKWSSRSSPQIVEQLALRFALCQTSRKCPWIPRPKRRTVLTRPKTTTVSSHATYRIYYFSFCRIVIYLRSELYFTETQEPIDVDFFESCVEACW
jgi:hypothetical protein